MTPTDQIFCIYNSDDQDVQVRMNHDGTINDFVLKRHQYIILPYAHEKKHIPFSIITLNGLKYKIWGGPSIRESLFTCMHSLKDPCPGGLSQHKELFCVCIVKGRAYNFYIYHNSCNKSLAEHQKFLASAKYRNFLDEKHLVDYMIKDLSIMPEEGIGNALEKIRQDGELNIRYFECEKMQ